MRDRVRKEGRAGEGGRAVGSGGSNGAMWWPLSVEGDQGASCPPGLTSSGVSLCLMVVLPSSPPPIRMESTRRNKVLRVPFAWLGSFCVILARRRILAMDESS